MTKRFCDCCGAELYKCAPYYFVEITPHETDNDERKTVNICPGCATFYLDSLSRSRDEHDREEEIALRKKMSGQKVEITLDDLFPNMKEEEGEKV